jgi:hypothetical protein
MGTCFYDFLQFLWKLWSSHHSTWQTANADQVCLATTQPSEVTVDTNESAQKLVNLLKISVQIEKKIGKSDIETLPSEVHCSGGYL